MTDIVGDFTLTITGPRIGGATESTAKVQIKRQGANIIRDAAGDRVFFPHESAHTPVPVSLPYTVDLPTDVTTGTSAELGYTVTVTTAHGGRTEAVFAAQPAGTTINFADLIDEVATPVSDISEAIVKADQVLAFGDTQDAMVAGFANDPTSETSAALSATVALPPIPALEGVPFYIEGDSYAQDNPPSSGTYATVGTLPFSRLAKRWRTATPTNTAAGGSRSDQILSRIISGYTINQAGVVGLGDLLINDTNTDADAAGGPTTSAATCRTIFEYLSARARLTIGGSSFAFGTGWASGVSSAAGSQFRVAFNGDAVVLLLNFGTGAGATLTAKNGATTVATITTGGYTRTFVGSVRLDGFGPGNHELTFTLDSGTATINSALIPNDPTSAPLIVWDKPGGRRYGATADTRLATYQTAAQTVADEFGNVLSVDMGAGWVPATMIGPDNGHRNDLGNQYAATRIHEAVAAVVTGHRQGINRLTATGAGPAYTNVAATPIIPPATVYSADTFDRADGAVGASEVGGFAWTAHTNSVFTIASNGLRVTTAGSVPVMAVDDGQAGGKFRVTRDTSGGVSGVVAHADSLTSLTQGYLFYNSGGWKLRKRSGGSWTLLGTDAATPAATAGDVLDLFINTATGAITCKVNGTTVITATDSAYMGNTKHGAYISTVNERVRDFEHTDEAA